MNRKEKGPSEKTVQERTSEMMDRARDGIVRFNTGVSLGFRGNTGHPRKGDVIDAFRRAGLFLMACFLTPHTDPRDHFIAILDMGRNTVMREPFRDRNVSGSRSAWANRLETHGW